MNIAPHGWFGAVDWAEVFSQDIPLLEIIVRGSLVYLGIFVLLRLVLKRQAGGMGITDLLVVVLIADAAQNGMADNYHSIPDGLVLVGVIIFWSYALDWLGYHIPIFERLISPKPLPLIRDGRMLYRNMRQELLTTNELLMLLREQGVENIREVCSAHMEGDGKISIILKEPKPDTQGPPEKRPV